MVNKLLENKDISFDDFIENVFSNEKITTIDSPDKLTKYILKILNENERCFYRGIDNKKNILPTLIREVEIASGNNGEYNIFNYLKNNASRKKIAREFEYKLIKDLINNASMYLNDFSFCGILTTAQHFGIPTRIIDWTNFFVALYFSQGNIENSNKYYYLLKCNSEDNIVIEDIPFIKYVDKTKFIERDAYNLNNMPIYTDFYYRIQQIEKKFKFVPNVARSKTKEIKNLTEKDKELRAYVKELVEVLYPLSNQNRKKRKEQIEDMVTKIKNGKIVFLKPNYNNIRISNQNGLFSIATNLDSVGFLKQLKNNCELIRIKTECKSTILNILESVGINPYRVMPDLSSVCSSIKTKIIQELKNNLNSNNN